MADRSYYEITCSCGHSFRSEATETTCPKCKAVIEIQWQAKAAGHD